MGMKVEKMKKTKNQNEDKPEPALSAQDNNFTTKASGSKHGNKKVITDNRFSSVHFDPRFQRVPKHQSKIKIDSRFDRMFTDPRFASSSAPLDKRGKPKNKNLANPLENYYELEKKNKDGNDRKIVEEEESEEEIENGDLLKIADESTDSKSNNEAESLNSLDVSEKSDGTSTSSDTDDDDDDEVDYGDKSEQQEENIPMIEQETRRLAIMNLDWSQIRAVDLYVLLSSFLPKDGQILSVSVYPSEFGLKRMEEEAVKGPVGLLASDEGKSDDTDDDEEEIDDEKLRAYEKSRLRYYYAVVECDASATADYLYKSCDGTELERTSNVLDLRFIHDSMEFKHPPRDVATEAPANYEALDFHTQALQHSKVHLSWEEDEPQRAKKLKRTFNADQLDELEFKEYIASDDGESDNDGALYDESEKKLDKWEKLRALLPGGDDSDGDGEENDKDMEVTFNTGLEDLSKHLLEKKKDKKSETVWEAYLRKRQEKRKMKKNRGKDLSEDESGDSDIEALEQPDDFFMEEPSVKSSKAGKSDRRNKQEQEADKEQEASRAELELLFADDQAAESNLKGYNLKPKKSKSKKGTEEPIEDKLPAVDYEDDPRFAAMNKSSLYALDPTDPQYKRSAAFARRKQRNGVWEETTHSEPMNMAGQAPLSTEDTIPKRDDQLQSDNGSSKKEKYELSSLVRSIKKKAQLVQISSEKNTSLKLNDLSKKKQKLELSSLVRSNKRKAEEPSTPLIQEPSSENISKKDANFHSSKKVSKKDAKLQSDGLVTEKEVKIVQNDLVTDVLG